MGLITLEKHPTKLDPVTLQRFEIAVQDFKNLRKVLQARRHASLAPTFDVWLQRNGGDDIVFDMVRNGFTITAIAKLLGIGPPTLFNWIKAKSHRKSNLELARQEAAHILVEQAEVILDELADKDPATLTKQEIALASKRVDFKKWKASMFNRDAYGRTPNRTNITNVKTGDVVGNLHLTAVSESSKVAIAKEKDKEDEEEKQEIVQYVKLGAEEVFDAVEKVI